MTASQRGASNRRKGAEAERAVARYLRTVGFGGAERAERNGWRTHDHVARDPGDILGVPGIVFSVKYDASNQVAKWLTEAEVLRNQHGAELALLVCRRPGKAEPSRWWVWASLASLARAVTGTPVRELSGYVCLELGDLVPMLHTAGYGDEQEVST